MPRLRHRCVLLYFATVVIVSVLILNAFIWLANSKNSRIKIGSIQHSSDEEDYYSLDFPGLLLDSNSSWFNISTEIDKVPKVNYKPIWSTNASRRSLPWFMTNGTILPSRSYSPQLAIWPEEIVYGNDPSQHDRIVNQLMYIPQGYYEEKFVPKGKLPLKKILLAYGKSGWGELPLGRKKFIHDKCPVNACYILSNPDLIEKSDAVIFKDRFVWPKKGKRPYSQIWILFLLECPLHTQLFKSLGPHVFNWTATYRHDSDIVTPYEKYVAYQTLISDATANYQRFHSPSGQKNYAAGKTKKIAWFVSNCGARNKRLEYARELSKHIEVDIYGSCGLHKCSRSEAKKCFEMLNKDYKFYLAFENSNCRDYITEKFFVNSLGHNSDELNIVPIVMGGHPDDYRRAAPENSYIHVDDFDSPVHLAHYINQLDQDDHAYNRFFQWKMNSRKGEFINTYFWCRLCALLHSQPQRSKPSVSYANLSEWWAPKNVCIDGFKKWPLTMT